MNQVSIILNHLMRYGTLSTSVARSKYGIQKLSARIKEMRNLGIRIDLRHGKYHLEGYKKPPKSRTIGEDDLFPDYQNQ